jgi:membrane-bound serine protease (ClpP class)
MHSLLLAIALQLVGVVAILAEIVIPSAGILSVAAIAAFGFSLYTMWVSVSVQVAVGVGLADLVIVPVAVWAGVRILARTPVALREQLSRAGGAVAQDPGLESIVGQTGEVLSDLRPSGRALIGGVKRDVVTTGDYLEQGAAVVVSEVNGNRIVVKRKNPSET